MYARSAFVSPRLREAVRSQKLRLGELQVELKSHGVGGVIKSKLVAFLEDEDRSLDGMIE